MSKRYANKIGWEDAPSTKTPVSAENLGKMDDALYSIDSVVDTMETDYKVLKAEVDQFSSLPPGETSGNAELLNIRIKTDGTTSDTAGNAVREQFGKLNTSVSQISDSNKNLWSFDKTANINGTQLFTFDQPLPAGRYCLSATVTSEDTTATVSRFQFVTAERNYAKDLQRGTRNSQWADVATEMTGIRMMASNKESSSTGKNCVWENIQLESGGHMTDYVEHKLTAKDEVAREMIENASGKIVKYVAKSGSDSNDGNTHDKPYLTISKALSEGANIIFVEPGTYVERLYATYSAVSIVGYDVTVKAPSDLTTAIIDFRYCDVNFSGITSVYGIDNPNSETQMSCYNLHGCTGKITNCVAQNGKYMGFRLDGSSISLERCTALNNAVDGFNAHDFTNSAGVLYQSNCTFIDCVAKNNLDDGLSFHESGNITVVGGEYANNGSSGIAPNGFCTANIKSAYIHSNGSGKPTDAGIQANRSETGTSSRVITNANVIELNNGYGIYCNNYNFLSCDDMIGNNVKDNTKGNISFRGGNSEQKDYTHIYSTEERVVGQWIDGKPVYERTMIAKNISLGTSSVYPYGTTTSDVDRLVSLDMLLYHTDGAVYPIPRYDGANGTYSTGWIFTNDKKVAIRANNTTTWLNDEIQTIIRYTKTTD